jgi:hypothetical protein
VIRLSRWFALAAPAAGAFLGLAGVALHYQLPRLLYVLSGYLLGLAVACATFWWWQQATARQWKQSSHGPEIRVRFEVTGTREVIEELQQVEKAAARLAKKWAQDA